MSKIEIRYTDGATESCPLSKMQPLSFGRQPVNDICIDEDGVAPLHCRIAWNNNGYELVSVHPEGTMLNGEFVKTALLKTNDQLQIGSVHITVSTIDEPAPAPPVNTENKPSQEEKDYAKKSDRQENYQRKEENDDANIPKIGQDDEESRPGQNDDRRPTSSSGPSLRDRIRQRADARVGRPGEQEVIRSKFILSLIVGTGVLLVVAAILWFWTQRNASETLYELAKAKHEEGKYVQAIEYYTIFLQKYPRDELAIEVHFARGRAKIDQHLSGKSSNWDAALKALTQFLKEHRSRAKFDEQIPLVLEYTQKIANGSAETAKTRRQRKFLPIAKDAEGYAKQYQASDKFHEEFRTLYRNAELAVRKEETFQAAVAKIERDLEKNETMTALSTRLDLLQSYPIFDPKNSGILDQLLTKTLDKEKSQIIRSEINRDALTQKRPERSRKPFSLTRRLRPQDGRTSDRSQIVLALAKQCCYGVDAITGEPIWRRNIGENSPFFPLPIQGTTQPAVLLFDTKYSELTLLNQLTGKLIWRQPINAATNNTAANNEQLQGAPLIHDGLIYLPTLSNHLYKISLDSGRLLTKLKFTQPINAAPLLVQNSKLILVGRKAMFYTIQLAPKMICESTSYSGHRAGSITAPLKKIGDLFMFCENDRNNSARLRVFNSSGQSSDQKKWLQELTPTATAEQIRVDGTVHYAPSLRNNLLFVTSTGERITVFSVSDDQKQPEVSKTKQQFLRQVARFQEKSTYEGPIHLVTGPNGQFWMATNRLRRFQLKPLIIDPATEETAHGRATQPPQLIGKNFYLGRAEKQSTAIILTQTDRELMQGHWQLVLGSSIQAWTTQKNRPIVCINESGHIFRIDPQQLANGKFQLKANDRIPTNKLTEPFRVFPLGNGSLGVATEAGDDSSFRIVNSQAQISRTIPLQNGIQTDPILLKNGVILPLPGRLKFVSLTSGQPRVADYEMPVISNENQQPKWTYLVAFGDQIIAADDHNGLTRIQQRTTSGRSLEKAVYRKLEHPVAQKMVVINNQLIMVDSNGTVQILSASSLQPTATVQLPHKATNSLWAHNGLLYVETNQQELHCFQVDKTFKKLWTKKLGSEYGLVGSPQTINSALMIAERNGLFHWLNPKTGTTIKTSSLGENINHLPRKIGDDYIVPSTDGSLHRITIPPEIQNQPK